MNVSRYSQVMLVVTGAVACSSGGSAPPSGQLPNGGTNTTTMGPQGGIVTTSNSTQGGAGQQLGGASQTSAAQGSSGQASSGQSSSGQGGSGQGGSGQGGSGQGGSGQSNGGTVASSSGGTTTTSMGGASTTGVGGACTSNGACAPSGTTCNTSSGQNCICSAVTSKWSCTGAAAGGASQGGSGQGGSGQGGSGQGGSGQGGAATGGAGTCVAVSGAACPTFNQTCPTAAGISCICNGSNVWSCTSPPGAGGAGAGGAVSTLGGAPATACSGTTKANTTSASGAKITLGKYYVVNNLWNASDGSGTQSVWSTCNNGYAIGWGTSFNWTGGANSVKSYGSAVIGWHWGWTVPIGNTQMPVPVGGSKAINCDWRYGVTRNGTVTMNVAYDLWIHSVALTGASNEWDVNGVPQFKPTDEIMIWLYRSNGAGPISTTGSPVATPSIASTTWDLHVGKITNAWNVYSYVRQANSDVGAVLNLQDFLKDLVSRGYLTTSKYLSSIEAGTEVYIGQGQLDVSSFSCEVK